MFSIWDVKNAKKSLLFNVSTGWLSFHCSFVGGNDFQKLSGPSSKRKSWQPLTRCSHFPLKPWKWEDFFSALKVAVSCYSLCLVGETQLVRLKSTSPRHEKDTGPQTMHFFERGNSRHWICIIWSPQNGYFNYPSPPKKKGLQKIGSHCDWRWGHSFLVRTHFAASRRSVSENRSFVLSCLNTGQMTRMILTRPTPWGPNILPRLSTEATPKNHLSSSEPGKISLVRFASCYFTRCFVKAGHSWRFSTLTTPSTFGEIHH